MTAEWQLAPGTLLVGLVLSTLLLLITSAQVRAWETTARHEAELRTSAAALRESEAKAQAADRAKDEFLATLSHELRTPLNAILGWVSMLRRGSVPPDRRAHGLVVIERNARLQAHLIEDLLDVSRIVMGKIRLQMGLLPVAPVISGAVESLRPSADAKGVHLHASLPPRPVVIQGDAERIQQIVWNLVANGIKFTPAGGHVYVALTHDDRHAHLSVRDTGIGITADFLPHVFERFRQADSSTTRPHPGIGIGLSIVQHLVELHGGSIDVRSDGPDRGAEFVLQFPIAAAEQSGVLLAETSLPSLGPPSVH
jgi:signal transduction histidine kinase